MSTSQNKMILDYLKGKSWFSRTPRKINTRIARTKFGVERLASRINDLRNQGHEIETISKKSINRFGKKCSYAEYKLI
jgi:hypothetical protein